jgi:hypothetical protein
MAKRPNRWGEYGPVLKLTFYLFRLSELISVSYWLRKVLTSDYCSRENNSEWDATFYGCYVLGWFGALILALVFAPLSGIPGAIFAWAALYRLQDLLFGTIGDAFEFFTVGGLWQSKVLLAILNIGQIVTIFAIAFAAMTPISAFSPLAPSGRVGHFFLSWSTLPPLGSGFAAVTTRARVMVMVESGVGVILTVIAVSRFLSKTDPTPTTSDRPTPTVPDPD